MSVVLAQGQGERPDWVLFPRFLVRFGSSASTRSGHGRTFHGSTVTRAGNPSAYRARGSGGLRQIRIRRGKRRGNHRGGRVDEGALYFHFSSKEELAWFVIAEQHRTSISAVEAIGCESAPALEQIVMLCHEMARQIVEDKIVRAGIRITLELSAEDRGPAGPYLDWITACQELAVRAVSEGICGRISIRRCSRCS